MLTTNVSFRKIVLEDGTFAVAQNDPTKPTVLEMIAIFYDEKLAEEYIAHEQGFITHEVAPEPKEEKIEVPVLPRKPCRNKFELELTNQQRSILNTLIQHMDFDNKVSLGNTTIAKETGVQIGSVFYALERLVAKNKIRLLKRGSAQKPSTFQVIV